MEFSNRISKRNFQTEFPNRISKWKFCLKFRLEIPYGNSVWNYCLEILFGNSVWKPFQLWDSDTLTSVCPSFADNFTDPFDICSLTYKISWKKDCYSISDQNCKCLQWNGLLKLNSSIYICLYLFTYHFCNGYTKNIEGFQPLRQIVGFKKC